MLPIISIFSCYYKSEIYYSISLLYLRSAKFIDLYINYLILYDEIKIIKTILILKDNATQYKDSQLVKIFRIFNRIKFTKFIFLYRRKYKPIL